MPSINGRHRETSIATVYREINAKREGRKSNLAPSSSCLRTSVSTLPKAEPLQKSGSREVWDIQFTGSQFPEVRGGVRREDGGMDPYEQTSGEQTSTHSLKENNRISWRELKDSVIKVDDGGKPH